MSVSLKQSYDIEYDGTANVARMDLFVDTAADLTGLTTFDSITLLQGSTAEDISTGDKYMMQTNGTWVKQPSNNAFANVYTKAEIDSMLYLYYTKTEADALFEWITVTISTDTLPLTFIADGSPLISWSMKGNGQQSGTPTPDNPIMPEFVGVRTANLFDNNAPDRTTTGYIKSDGSIQSSASFSASGYIPISGLTTITLSEYGGGNEPAYCLYDSNKEYISGSAYTGRTAITLTVGTASFIRMSYRNTAADTAMLNSGSTAMDYEPYGYKIPITCAGQTVPVYLGQVQTVRRVKKQVFDGTETITEESENVYSITIPDTVITDIGISTHFEYDAAVADGQFRIDIGKAVFGYNDTTENFAAFLASQYAAGNPVTVWYILATTTTGIVNEPLSKIGDYADELSSTDAAVTVPIIRGENTLTIGTTLQPSEITITGKIREVNENEQ